MSLSKVFGGKLALYNTKSWISITPVIQEVGTFIYTGSIRTSNISTKKYLQSQDGLSTTEVWSLDSTGGDANGIAVDAAGNVYVAGGTVTRKYDSSANLLWSVDHGTTLQTVAVDASGNVYVGGSRTVGNVTTRKYDSSGNLLWSLDHGTTISGISVDTSGNVYTVGSRTSQVIADQIDGGQRYTTRKYNSSGSLLWSRDHMTVVSTNTIGVNCVAVDSSGNVYTGGSAGVVNLTTRKYNSSGTLLWSVNHGNGSTNIAIAVDPSGNVYIGGTRSANTGNVSTRKLNSSGGTIWSRDHGNSVFAIAVDSSGNVYAGGNRTGVPEVTVRKYDSSGTLLWSIEVGTTQNRGIALSTNVSTLTQWI